MGRWILGAAASVGVLLGAGCAAATTPPSGAAALERFEFSRLLMGVHARAVVYAPTRAVAADAASAAFARVAELEEVLSDYRPSSELMRLCDGAGGPPVPVSEDLFRVLDRAREIGAATGGALDMTVGPVIALWRAARASGRLPEPDSLAAALRLVGWDLVELDPATRTVRLARPGMRLDAGGIGKGHAAAEAVRVLRARGTPRCLVALAGDIALGDAPPGEPGWRVALPASLRGALGLPPGDAPPVLVLRDTCVSTSGDTEQFIEIDGVRYSHIVDPRTGLGATTRATAAVVSPDGALADALASAICVLGVEAGLESAGRLGAAAAAAEDRDGSPRRGATPGMHAALSRDGARVPAGGTGAGG